MGLESLRLSTAGLAEADRDDVIRDFYGRISQRMELGIARDERAEIDVVARALPGLHVGGGCISRMWAHRTAGMRSDGTSDVVLSFALDGSVVRETGKADVEVAPGDALLTSLDRPISLLMPVARSRVLTVQVARERLAPLVPDLDDRLTGSISAAAPAMRLLQSYAQAVHGMPLGTGELGELAARQLTQLLALAIGPTAEAREMARGGGVPAARLAEAKARILRQLHVPHLSAGMIARQLEVSPRYLHMLFETGGVRFAQFVSSARLEQVRGQLCNPQQRHRRIIDIAIDCGFGDVRTFNRAFRRAFGCTPTEARADPALFRR